MSPVTRQRDSHGQTRQYVRSTPKRQDYLGKILKNDLESRRRREPVTPILATKLYIPPPRPNVVLRPRLIERLNEGLHRKLTLICGPRRLWQDHAGQRMGRRLRATGRLAVAGRRG